MHQESRRKLDNDPRVRYVEADVLSWEPDRSYDVVFFASWLSHVPPGLFDRFWDTVGRALTQEGRVFLTDENKDASRYEHLRDTFIADDTVPVVTRPLRDGTSFNVVKVFWDPDELAERVHMLGWDISMNTAGPFYWAEAHPSV